MNSQLLEGSCYDILPSLPKGQFKLAFVDPPYNIGIDYGNGKKACLLYTSDAADE